MGQLCCIPSRNKYTRLEKERTAALRPFSSKLHQRVLPYENALEEVQEGRCMICLDNNIADEETYTSWENPHHSDLELLDAPTGIFGSLCDCAPDKTLMHLECLTQQINNLVTDTLARRTCAFCNKHWIVIQTENPGSYVNLTPLEEPNELIPAWRWNDIKAGDYWVRILAGDGAFSSPANINLDLPDAYKTVQVEIYNLEGHLVDISNLVQKSSTAKKFSEGMVGKFITWREVREILNQLETP